MKLTLRVTTEDGAAGSSATEAPLVIRNPKATVANLRAAIAVTLKAPTSALRLLVDGTELTDDKAALSAATVTDGCVVEVIRKRVREEDAAAAAAASAAAQPSARRHRTEGAPPAAADIDSVIAAALGAHGAQGLSSEDDDSDAPLDENDLDSMDDDDAFEFGDGLDGDSMDDDASDLFNELEDGEEETPEMQEQAELVAGLVQLPNFETLKARFDADPRAAMADIQTTNPQLFNLIARHTQMFLDFLNSPVEDLSGDDDDDSDDGGLGVSRLESNAPVMSGGAGAASPGAAAQRPSGSSAPTAAAASPSAAQRNPTEADTRNIEELMQLGFTREKATEAYWRHGRNPNRAAAWLFDQQQ